MVFFVIGICFLIYTVYKYRYPGEYLPEKNYQLLIDVNQKVDRMETLLQARTGIFVDDCCLLLYHCLLHFKNHIEIYKLMKIRDVPAFGNGSADLSSSHFWQIQLQPKLTGFKH